MTAAWLETRDLGMQFEGLAALSEISLTIPAGEIRGLIGPNGAGKTTFFNCLTGFYAPTGGQVLLDGVRMDGLAPHEISNLGVSRTFQNIRLFAGMTAIENVLVGAHTHARQAAPQVRARRERPQTKSSIRFLPGGDLARFRAMTAFDRMVAYRHAPRAVANALTQPWLGQSRQPLYLAAGLENAD